MGKKDNVGNWSQLGMTEKPSFSIHSHPDITPTPQDELFSMGLIVINGKKNAFNPIRGFDWDNMQNRHQVLAEKYLIYFPNSGNFYRIAYPNKLKMKNGLFRQYRR